MHQSTKHRSDLSCRYSSMAAILDLHSSKKQRLEVLFDFLTEGPHIPEQNIMEPTASRLVPWSISYWKRGLAGVPLHGSVLDTNDVRPTEVNENLSSDFLECPSYARWISLIFKILRLFFDKLPNVPLLQWPTQPSSESTTFSQHPWCHFTSRTNLIHDIVRRVLVVLFPSDLFLS